MEMFKDAVENADLHVVTVLLQREDNTDKWVLANKGFPEWKLQSNRHNAWGRERHEECLEVLALLLEGGANANVIKDNVLRDVVELAKHPQFQVQNSCISNVEEDGISRSAERYL